MNRVKLGVFGIIFGFFVGRIGFGDYGATHQMHLFSDLRMFLAFAGGVVLSTAGLFFVARPRSRFPRPLHKGTIPGSILFGVGWAVTGACPAIALIQIGQGQLAGVFTGIGIASGVWLQKKAQAKLRWDTGSCDT